MSSPWYRRVARRAVPGARARAELDRAHRRIARLEARLAARDDLGYLFVVTYGRSGSTLLQGVLNSIPGYLIRGENRQALRHLRAYYRTGLTERRSHRRRNRARGLPPDGPTDPFFGIDGFPRKGTQRAIRRLVLDTLLRPEPDTRVTGFKEIRWATEDTAEYVDWLRQVFPGARFVINIRNLDDVAQSNWWQKNPKARQHLETVHGRLLALAESLGEQAFVVSYDEYTASAEALRPLYDWLGEDFDVERVRAVLDVRHSY